MKDDKPLKSSDKYKILKDKSKHTLVIENVTFDDNGKYVVIASNPSGKSKYTAKLVVKGWFTDN